ncbi:MAG: hypothetical protein ACE15E_07590 [Acidobacteriota bacterium]
MWSRFRLSASLALFLTCWLVYSLHFATNTVREIYPALSLGDHLSFDVSEYAGMHPDIFELPGRGAFINNNPGASILAAVPYAVFRPAIDLTVKRVRERRDRAPRVSAKYKTIYPMAQDFYREARARGFDVKFGLAAAVMHSLLMAPLSALSVVLMFTTLRTVTGNRLPALLSALLYAFATPVFYRTAQLNHNLLLAHFAFFAFLLLWRPGRRPGDGQRPRYFLAGLLAGWTVVFDYSGVVALLALAAYALVRRFQLSESLKSRSDLPWFTAGVLLSLMVLLGYQWACFGNPIYPAQHYMPVTPLSPNGYQGIDWPSVRLLWETAFSARFGLFTSAPLLLLALVPWAWTIARRMIGSLQTLFVLCFVLGFFVFCAMNQYGLLQFNTGVRHVVPVVPFLFLLVPGILTRLPAWIAATVSILATYWSWCLAMYRDVEQGRGIIESIIQVTLSGPRLPWAKTLEGMGYLPSQVPILPLFFLAAVTIWLIWSRTELPAPRSGRTDRSVRSAQS